MPLSEYEQRVLDQLERDLGSDPKLKTVMTRAPRTAGQLVTAAAAVVIGLAIVLAGVMTKIWLVGIAGFALMAAVVLWALAGASRPRPGARSPGHSASAPKAGGFMTRLEDRFEKRRENGEL